MDDHPLGFTDFELLEETGGPFCWAVEDDQIETVDRLEDYPGWIVRARFLLGGSGLYLVRLTIEPASFLPWPPSPILTTAVIRNVHVDRLYRTTRTWLSVRNEVGIDVDVSDFHLRRRPGRSRRADLFYASAAARYVELLKTSSSPTTDLAHEMDLRPSQGRDLLHQARQRKLLTASEKGKAGGALTAKALSLLGIDEHSSSLSPEKHPDEGATPNGSRTRTKKKGK